MQIIWNSPWPRACPAGWAQPPTSLLTDLGVTVNDNAAMDGAATTIIYATPPGTSRYPGCYFGTFPTIGPNGTRVNGGVPQRGNLTAHLERVRADVVTLFPDANYSGIAVHARFLTSFLSTHKGLSRALVLCPPSSSH